MSLISSNTKYRKTGDDLRVPLSPPQNWEIKLPKVLWINIYQFLAGDIRVSDFHAIVLAAKDIAVWGRLSYGMRAVVAHELISSLFRSFKPLVQAISPLSTQSRQAAKQAIERLTKISYGDILEVPRLQVEITDPASLSIVKSRSCPLYTLPLPRSGDIDVCLNTLRRVDLPPTRPARPVSYMPPAAFCKVFQLLMHKDNRAHFCLRLVREMGSGSNLAPFNVAPFLPLEDAASFLKQIVINAIYLNCLPMIEQFLSLDQGVDYLVNFEYGKYNHPMTPRNIVHTTAAYGHLDMLMLFYRHERLRPLFFETSYASVHATHLAIAQNRQPDILSFMLRDPALNPLAFTVDYEGSTILHHAAINTATNMVQWIVDQGDPKFRDLLTHVSHSGSNIAHTALAYNNTPVLIYLDSLEEPLKNLIQAPLPGNAKHKYAILTTFRNSASSLEWLSSRAPSVLISLLEATDPFSQDTLAHVIAASRKLNVLKWLFQEKYAHPLFSMKNRFGQTPFDIAFQRGDQEILQMAEAEPADSPIAQSYAAAKQLHAGTNLTT
jgi:ankyrin repeat protein